MAGLSDAEARLLLTMVDRSGRELTPDDHADDFEDYADILLATRSLPGIDLRRADEAAAGALDVDIYLGVGLALLGQVGLLVLREAGTIAIQRGAQGVVDLAQRLFHRRRSAADPPVPDGPWPERAVVDALTERITVEIGRQVPVTAEQVRVIVTVQLRALAEADDAGSGPAGPA